MTGSSQAVFAANSEAQCYHNYNLPHTCITGATLRAVCIHAIYEALPYRSCKVFLTVYVSKLRYNHDVQRCSQLSCVRFLQGVMSKQLYHSCTGKYS